MSGSWVVLHFDVFLVLSMDCRSTNKPLGGSLTWLEWLMGNGVTSFTFSLLTFSWSRPNKGKYSVANLACWLWKTNKSLSRISLDDAPLHRYWSAAERQESVEVIKHLLWRCSGHQMCALSSDSSAPGWQSDESPWTPAEQHSPPWAAAPPGSGSCRSHLLASNPAGGLRGGEEEED